LSAARIAAAEVGATDVAFIGLAKKEEEIYLAARPDPVRLPRTSQPLRLLQRVRNEAHRFAHSYNSKLRTKRTLRSELGDIPGVGPSRQRTLLEKFGSVKAVKEADVSDIAALPGFSMKLAEHILSGLNGILTAIAAKNAGNAKVLSDSEDVAESRVTSSHDEN
jgi:excinuclease ABC subunit C